VREHNIANPRHSTIKPFFDVGYIFILVKTLIEKVDLNKQVSGRQSEAALVGKEARISPYE
jgi:hypothetical protein